MKISTKGVTRIVFIFDRFVIKIPNFLYSQGHFLRGCCANWNERWYTKSFKNVDNDKWYNSIAPTIYTSLFGLVSIQIKVTPLTRKLEEEEYQYFKELGFTDIKKENVGVLNDRLVMLDYE